MGKQKLWKLDYSSSAKALGRVFLSTLTNTLKLAALGAGMKVLTIWVSSSYFVKYPPSTLVSVIPLERPRQDLLHYLIRSMLIKV